MAKLDSLSEKIRQALINNNSYYKDEFLSMSKVQLRNEVKGLVDDSIKVNEECVAEGIKHFSSRRALIADAIAIVCEEALHISLTEYNKFMG